MNTVLLLFVCCVLAACNPAEQTNQNAETAISGQAEVLCDAEVVNLIQPAQRLFDSVTPKATITLVPVPANEAVLQLMQHKARAIVVARDWFPEERQEAEATKGDDGYPRTLIARDALVFYANKDFPYDTMHADHIREWVRTGKFPLSSYPQLKKKPILIVPGSASSVYGNLRTVVLNGTEPCTDCIHSLGTTDSVKAGVHGNVHYIGVGYLSGLVRDTSVKMLRLSWTDSTGQYQFPRLVHAGNLVQGLYPFPVPIYVVLRDRANQYSLPSGFALYLARDGKAQRSFFDAGIEPGFAKIVIHTPE